MAKKTYFEMYPDIYHFMDTIERRPNNKKFGDSSQKMSGDGWSGTRTWDEAVTQFSTGLPEVTEKLKMAMDQFTAKSNIITTKRTPRNYYYGYSPNIPAAIIGLPKSMYHIHRIPQKTKTIGILWNSTQNCGTKAETLQKSGESVLQLVYMLERKGYRVQLDVTPFSGADNERNFVCIVNLKQYSQHMDILKLSFPVTSPAMFRRFGFKWAEGIPGVTGSTVFGYSRQMDKKDLLAVLEKNGYNNKSMYCISVNDCEEVDFDPVKMAEKLGILI